MTKLPPNYIDETVARWTTANDEHVLKEPKSVPLTLLDSKEFRILDHDIAVRNARQAQARAIGMLLRQLGLCMRNIHSSGGKGDPAGH